MIRQHTSYLDALEGCGVKVHLLDSLPGYPDAHFVEDTAVITPEMAVISRPGATSRRGEIDTIEEALSRFRPTENIKPPGTLDGGDVLIVDRHVFIGISERTDDHGAAQLNRILEPAGYTTAAVPLQSGLHLKSSVNALGKGMLVVTREMEDNPAFKDFKLLILDDGDEYAANSLFVNGRLLVPSGFPRALAKYESTGNPVQELDLSEAQKMDGGLTCLSLRF